MPQVEISIIITNVTIKMLDQTEDTEYCLVFFEPLAGHIYHRTNEDGTKFDEMKIDGTRISPTFKHHCHPYIAIQNAIPKFLKHEATLTEEQEAIYIMLKAVERIREIYFKTVERIRLSSPKKRGGPPADDAENDNASNVDRTSGQPPGKRRRTAGGPNQNEDAGNRDVAPAVADAGGAQRRSKRPELPTTLSATSSHEESEGEKEWFCHPDWTHVTTWRAGIPKVCDPVEEQNLVWPVNETPQPPLPKVKVRDRWTVPPDTSKFSSNNWATYLIGIGPDCPRSPPSEYSE